jgi:hypothetical protein
MPGPIPSCSQSIDTSTGGVNGNTAPVHDPTSGLSLVDLLSNSIRRTRSPSLQSSQSSMDSSLWSLLLEGDNSLPRRSQYATHREWLNAVLLRSCQEDLSPLFDESTPANPEQQ